MRTRLATEIKHATSRMALYTERGFPASLGFDRYSVALERTEAPRRAFPERDDLWGDLTASQALILATAGPCSTFRFGDVLLGTDKLEHFLASGETWYRWSRHGAELDRALAKGTHREHTWDGPWSSRVFSYADLAADLDGYRFYAGLLTEGSALRRGPDGCVTQVRPWAWREWVAPAWDEVLDPPVYNHQVQAGVDRRIDADLERYCRAWRALTATQRDAAAHPPPSVPWATAEAPTRGDPYHLSERCGVLPVDPHVPSGLPGDEPVAPDRGEPLEGVDGER